MVVPGTLAAGTGGRVARRRRLRGRGAATPATGECAVMLPLDVGGAITGGDAVEVFTGKFGEVRLFVAEDGVVEGGSPRRVVTSRQKDLVAGGEDSVHLENMGTGGGEDVRRLSGGGGDGLPALLPRREGIFELLHP
eukprot:TRINITY_DN10710_c0_g1_i1.p2 TRINITY_DN10710_c0_g1~~TRINITY_DN10710_c0_g1_i1.p2  ORF type:complete len:149 (-),score=14.78 TRINITY_DN10710_c0_g1_i1:102-512(-)